MRLLALLLALMFVAPAVAEFGAERDGYPVNVHGETVVPWVPSDLAGLHDEAGAHGHAPGARGDPVNKPAGLVLYPYYPLLTAEVQRLANDHPDLVRVHSAGQSIAGLDIWLLEIADFGNPDRVPLAEREVVYLDGGTHSNEYSGVYFVLEWAQFLLDEYETNETARWIVDNRHTYILPMVNPDGSNAFGRINAKTVNINRNFPSTWGTVDETPGINWPGPYPASEPETQAVLEVLSDVRPDYVNSIHCCGNLWLYPFGAEHLGVAVDDPMFSRVCNEVFADVRDDCGPIWSTIYPASGTTADEGYGAVGAASWSYEMSGRGAVAPWGQPVINNDPRTQEIESWRGVMHAFLHADKYGAAPRITGILGDDEALTVTVENQGWGNVSEGSVRVAGREVALPPLTPGESFTFEIAGPHAEALPAHVVWKKRLHPDSNWGDVRFTVPLASATGGLVGLLPEIPQAPSMGDLLPVVDLPLDDPAQPVQEADAKDAPAIGLLAIAALAALAVALRRR